jgi:3-hydroxyacyl-[acyl-carrier-protein] dehydratase
MTDGDVKVMNETPAGNPPAAPRQLATADVQKIMQLLPHRYPFLLLDKIIDIDRDESAIGIKNVTINEPFFQGHFPAYPVMPGVLIIEALAQTAGAICVHNAGVTDIPQIVYFMGIEGAKFRKPVLPGDQLHLHVKKVRNRGSVWRFRCEAKVDGHTVAEADISAMIVDPRHAKKG